MSCWRRDSKLAGGMGELRSSRVLCSMSYCWLETRSLPTLKGPTMRARVLSAGVWAKTGRWAWR